MRRFTLIVAVGATFAAIGPMVDSATAGLLRAKKSQGAPAEALPGGTAIPQGPIPQAGAPYAPAPNVPPPYDANPNDAAPSRPGSPVPIPPGAVPHVVYLPVPAPVALPTPKISYRHAALPLRKVKGDPCLPPLETVLCVVNPCTKCPAYVPVCLPNCCCEAPQVSCGKSLLRGEVTTFAWCCGVSVEVRFAKCGDVLVTYRGA